MHNHYLELRDKQHEVIVSLSGSWHLESLTEIRAEVETLTPRPDARVALDGSRLDHLDTSGALLALRLAGKLGTSFESVSLQGFALKHQPWSW